MKFRFTIRTVTFGQNFDVAIGTAAHAASSATWNLYLEHSSNLLLAFASTVILGFGPRRGL
jgi:hypothetical protein